MSTPPRLAPDFLRLNVSQFTGALNDNIFKLLGILFLVNLHGAAEAARVSAMAGFVFVLPFLLLSAAAGVMADRWSKRHVLVFCKWLEVAAMAIAVAAFAFRNEPLLYVTLFLMATTSALFSPSKYGIVPELVPRDQLPRANSLLVMATFLAIVLGSAGAPLFVDLTRSNYVLAQGGCVLIAIAGLLVTLRMKPTPPAGSKSAMSPLFVRDIWRTLWSIRGDRYLLQAVIASAYFTMLGAYMQLNLLPYGIERLGLENEKSGYLFFIAALGIAAGAFVSGRLSGRNIEFGIAPLGALILAASAVALKIFPPLLGFALPAIASAGFGAGLFVVPIDSFVQAQAPERQRGEILAASSFLSWVGVLIASGLVMLTVKLHWSAATGFLMMGGLTLVLVVFTLKVLPDFLIRFILLVIMRLAYRIRIIGAPHVPLDGAAVLVCNHVSHLDALLLVATQQRRIRFLMSRAVYEEWRWLKPIFNLMGCIPIDPKGSPKQLAQSLAAARAALADGFMVGVFAEGTLTRTGNIREFHRGFEFLVRETGHPVIPVYIGGAWGAITSYYRGQRIHSPRLLRYPVTVLFGPPLPSTASANDVRLAVMELSCSYYEDQKSIRRPLGETFARIARANWRQHALSDTTGRRLTYGRLLAAAVLLSRKLPPPAAEPRMIALLLPPSAGGAIANLAVSLAGHTAVNLNFTASADSFRSALRQASPAALITSRAFLEKIGPLPLPENPVYIEDLLASATASDKRNAWLRARLFPLRLLARVPAFQPDRVAAILFSSGSTGQPKGIMLSHHNILSNIESLRAVFHASPTDNVCAALPLFHSLGYTGTIWFPFLSGFSAAFHPNPLDAAAIAQVVRENRSTLLFATPTFLLLYLRKATREDFATLHFVVAGAEKLKPRLAQAFEDRFGIRPLEGYGATELSPVATLSLPHVEEDGVSQKGWKEGSVGLPLPGVAMKVVDPDTGAGLPVDQPGLLLVKGPNVMLGYLGRPDLTADAIRDGWYRTGDVARIDSEGFVVITDRLSRFSKIGGEMIPHLAVEEELSKQLGATGPVLAVTAAPDERKGEKLVVLYTDEAGDADKIARAIAAADLPNLWKPAPAACFRIDSIPVLGTGKTDLKALKDLAANRTTTA